VRRDGGLSEEALTPYVPRLVIEWLRETPAANHRRISGTLAFVDISGFTKLTERLARKGKAGAEEVNDVLDLCFTRLLDVAYDNGGAVLKWGGDAVLVLFTGPEHAARASRSAFGMRRTLRQFGRVRTSVGFISLRMSVGIHSGEFDFFLVGRSHRELLVTGPAATATVAMETLASAGEIALSPRAVSFLPAEAVGRTKGEARLLKAEPIPLAELAQPGGEPVGLDIDSCVPVMLRRHLLSGGGDTEHRHVGVAFLQFQGVDALIAESGAAPAASALDGLIGAVQHAADEHGVTFLATDIDRDGGKVILVAGAPQASGNDEERLLRAVREIADGDYGLSVRTGVNAGHVVAGDFGPSYRRTYTILGDAVNLAARIMGRAELGQMLATEPVLAKSRTTFEAAPLEPFLVKGKRRPVQAFDVGPIMGSRQAAVRADLPLVGRQPELRELLGALRSARDGRGRVIEIVAEPGLGKSRLLEELRARADGLVVESATCDPYESSTPYHPFRGLLRRLVGIPLDADPSRGGRLLEQRVRQVAPHLLPWLPLLATPMYLEVAPTPESEQLDEEFRRARLDEATEELIVALLPNPALLIFEDVHWMDEPSADLLRRLVLSVHQRPWLICASRRQQATGFAAPEASAAVKLELSPITGDDAAALATLASEDAPLSPHAIAALAQRSGGNPLFLQELVAAAQATKTVDALPDTVEALVAAQIDRLPAGDRTLLRYASVLGPRFEPNLLGAALNMEGPAGDVRAVTERLTDYIVSEPSGYLQFRHALIRDVAYEGLPYRRRRELHARVGETIAESAGPKAAQQAELLSFHFFAAGQYDRAWTYSRLAGERARSKFANVEAADFYQRAVESARRLGDIRAAELVPMLEALGDVSERAGMYRSAANAYRDARRLLSADRTTQARLLLKAGVIQEHAGRYSDALRWYGRALRLLEDNGLQKKARAVRADIGVWYASARREQGRYSEAIGWCERAIDDARTSGEQGALAHAYRILGDIYATLGNPEGTRYLQLALRIYEELEDLSGQSEALNELGVAAYFSGRWTEALDLYRRSSEARRKTGDEANAAHGINNIAEILSDQGRLDEAQTLFHDVLRVWRAAGFRLTIAIATSNLGRVAARSGRYDEAMRLYREALEGFRTKQAEIEALEAQARMAETLVLAGRADEAVELATTTLDRVVALHGRRELQALLHRVQGYALMDRDPETARRSFEESLRVARRASAEYEVALTLRASAALAGKLGLGEARDLEEEASQILGRLGVVSVAEPAHSTAMSS
jgi:class 3 adenylate cyclase/tetratricopeptide (TPR) repeat protein